MSTKSFHERINDHKLSLGMVRYSTGEKDTDDHLWRLIVSDHCGATIFTSVDVVVADLMRIKNFCDKAIEILNNDGGRRK